MSLAAGIKLKVRSQQDGLKRLTAFVLLAVALTLTAFFAEEAHAFQIYREGNASDVVVANEPATCLGGGGSDARWSQGWRFLLEHARGGDVVVIRSDKLRGGYAPFILDQEEDRHYGFPRMNSVTTLVLEAASDAEKPEAEAAVRKAELVFFAGGEQNYYLDWLRHSRLGAAIQDHVRVKQAPIGGTSAGAMIQGGIDYSARYRGSGGPPYYMVTPEDALRNPTASNLDLDRSFLVSRFLTNVITDTHFGERRREGRLVGLMARAIANRYPHVYYSNIKGLGVDTNTAVCFDQTGLARVYGTGKVTFLIGNAPIERIEPGQPLLWNGNQRAVRAYSIMGETPHAFFDLKNWRGHGGCEEAWWVDASQMNAPASPVLPQQTDDEEAVEPPQALKRAVVTGECNFVRRGK